MLAELTDVPVDDAFCALVATLPAEDQVQVVAAKLQKLNPGFDGKMDVDHLGSLIQPVQDGTVRELSFSTMHVADISPLRALPSLRRLYCGSRVPGQRGQLANLSPLRGIQLTTLWLDWCRVEDLSPLEAMPLIELACMGNFIKDLRPCNGMPLQSCYCHTNQIVDLTPLRSRHLRHLNCGLNPIQNWDAVRGMRLESLTAFQTDLSDLTILADSPVKYLFIQETKVQDLSAATRQTAPGLALPRQPDH